MYDFYYDSEPIKDFNFNTIFYIDDYWLDLETVITGIENNAEVNIIEEIEINGTSATISNKKANFCILKIAIITNYRISSSCFYLGIAL